VDAVDQLGQGRPRPRPATDFIDASSVEAHDRGR
jgi:hypothetical protein